MMDDGSSTPDNPLPHAQTASSDINAHQSSSGSGVAAVPLENGSVSNAVASSSTLPPAPSTSTPHLPSHPSPNPSIRPPPTSHTQPSPNSPLPKQLQDQFWARFKIPPPATHGQLTTFLKQATAHAQAQAAKARGMGPGAGLGNGSGSGSGNGAQGGQQQQGQAQRSLSGSQGSGQGSVQYSQGQSPATSNIQTTPARLPAALPSPAPDQQVLTTATSPAPSQNNGVALGRAEEQSTSSTNGSAQHHAVRQGQGWAENGKKKDENIDMTVQEGSQRADDPSVPSETVPPVESTAPAETEGGAEPQTQVISSPSITTSLPPQINGVSPPSTVSMPTFPIPSTSSSTLSQAQSQAQSQAGPSNHAQNSSVQAGPSSSASQGQQRKGSTPRVQEGQLPLASDAPVAGSSAGTEMQSPQIGMNQAGSVANGSNTQAGTGQTPTARNATLPPQPPLSSDTSINNQNGMHNQPSPAANATPSSIQSQLPDSNASANTQMLPPRSTGTRRSESVASNGEANTTSPHLNGALSLNQGVMAGIGQPGKLPFAGLGHIPAGTDVEMLKKQIMALKQSQDKRRYSASNPIPGMPHPMTIPQAGISAMDAASASPQSAINGSGTLASDLGSPDVVMADTPEADNRSAVAEDKMDVDAPATPNTGAKPFPGASASPQSVASPQMQRDGRLEAQAKAAAQRMALARLSAAKAAEKGVGSPASALTPIPPTDTANGSSKMEVDDEANGVPAASPRPGSSGGPPSAVAPPTPSFQGMPPNAIPHTGPPSSGAPANGPRRLAPQQQAQMAAQFYASLRQHLQSRNVAVPPTLFAFEPADPNDPTSTPTNPGAIDICGRKVDLLKMWFGISANGGYARARALGLWSKVPQSYGLPITLPAPYPLPRTADELAAGAPTTTTDAVEVLEAIYRVYLLSFEESQRRHNQAMQMARMQQNASAQPQADKSLANGDAPTPSVPAQEVPISAKEVQASTEQAGNSTGATPASTRESGQPAGGVQSVSDEAAAVKQPESGAVSVQPEAAVIGEPSDNAAQSPRLRTETDMIAIRQRMMLQAQQQAMLQSQAQANAAEANPMNVPVQRAASGTASAATTRPSSSGDHMHVDQDKTAAGQAKTAHGGLLINTDVVAGTKRKAEDLGQTDSPATTSHPPSTRGVSPVRRPERPPPPKRARFKISYNPLSRTINSPGGWDLDTIMATKAENQRARDSVIADELGRVDIEDLCLRLQSGIRTELSYALTVLDILSMPGKGDDKGGLALVHCGELLNDLVELVESQAFGEEGWEAWSSAQAGRLGGADGAHVSAAHVNRSLEDPLAATADLGWAVGHQAMVALVQSHDFRTHAPYDLEDKASRIRVETVLVAVNLLRNFSMMSDNNHILTKHPKFLNIMAKVCDMRLVGTAQYNPDGPAIFRSSDILRLREDVLETLHGLAAYIDLEAFPVETAQTIFDLLLSCLTEATNSSGARSLVPGGETLFLSDKAETSLDILCSLTTSDRNRRVFRKLGGEMVLEAFRTCLKLLPLGAPAVPVGRRYNAWLEWQHKVSFCLYNLAFLSLPSTRATLRHDHSALSSITIAMQVYSKITVNAYQPPLIARRLSEVIGVLNGPDELSGNAYSLTFGCNASSRGVKGWSDSKAILEPGLLLMKEEQLLLDMLNMAGNSRHADAALFKELSRAF